MNRKYTFFIGSRRRERYSILFLKQISLSDETDNVCQLLRNKSGYYIVRYLSQTQATLNFELCSLQE